MDSEKTGSLSSPLVVGLGIEVKDARDVFASDSNGFSDPYCVVTVGPKSKKTKIISKSLNPKWNQKFAL